MSEPGQLLLNHARELTVYATFLVGPVDSQRVIREAWTKAAASSTDPGPTTVRPWLYRLVYEVAHDWFGRSPTVESQGGRQLALPLSDRSDLELLATLESLSLTERAAFYLTYAVRLEPSSVGAQLGVTAPEAGNLIDSAAHKVGLVDGRTAREFIGRLEALAPSPPDVNPDVQARPHERSPRVIVWVTAIAVVLLVAPLLVFGGDPPAGATSTIAEEPPPGAVSFTGVVYLVQDAFDSVNGNAALVAFEVSAVDQEGILDPDDNPVEFLTKMTDLNLSLPSNAGESEESPTGAFYSMIPSGTRIESMSTVEVSGSQVLRLDMHQDFLQGAGNEVGDIIMLNQLVFTATQGNPDQLVWFTVGETPIEAFGTAALDISDPIGRDSFLDALNPIIVTEPVVADVDSQTIIVRGMANEGAGTVSYVVSNPQGDGGQSGTIPVDCGAGCWGEFNASLPSSAMLPDGTIQLFDGPADGPVRSNRLELYMPAGFDGRWNLTP